MSRYNHLLRKDYGGALDFKGAVSHFVNVSGEVIYAIAKNSIAKSY